LPQASDTSAAAAPLLLRRFAFLQAAIHHTAPTTAQPNGKRPGAYGTHNRGEF
jgi:hypothetical protein